MSVRSPGVDTGMPVSGWLFHWSLNVSGRLRHADMCCAGAATRTFGLMPLCLVTAAARAPTEPSQRWLPPAVAVTERAVAAEPVVPVGLAIVPAGTERDPARPHPSQHLPPRLSLLSYRRGAAPLSPTTDMLDLRGDSAWLPVGCRRRLYEQSEPRALGHEDLRLVSTQKNSHQA